MLFASRQMCREKKWPGSGGGDRVVKTRQSHTTARVKRGKFDGIFQKEVRARDVFATPRTGPSHMCQSIACSRLLLRGGEFD